MHCTMADTKWTKIAQTLLKPLCMLYSSQGYSIQNIVRPKLEYASSVWDPHHKNKIEKLEKVQRKAARWVRNQYSWTASVSDFLRQLEWPPLHQRRLCARLVIMFRIKNNDIAITLPSYVDANNTNNEIPSLRAMETHQDKHNM